MTINVAETVRKVMGWCPNASITERKTKVEYDLASTNSGLPVKKWRFDLLILGHVCALLFASLFILPMSVYRAFDLYNSSYLALNYGAFLADITLSIASMLFSVATVVLIYDIIITKKLSSKLCYFNVILLSGLFIAIILELSLIDNHRLEESLYWAFVFALLPLIPSLMNIRFNKRYGEQKIVTEGLGLVELIKRAMGWCPIRNQNNYQTSYINSGSSSTYNGTSAPTSLQLHLNNTYAVGLGKEAIIGLFFAVTIFVLSFKSGNNSFFFNYGLELILLSIVLMQYVMLKSNVEINDTDIRVNTMLHWILGSTTHSLDSIKKIRVQKNQYKLGYWGLFTVGTLWLFLLFSDIFAGKPVEDFAQGLIMVVFCFGYGYIIYITSKSVYHIRISFDPHPSINHLMIHTKDAQQIADMLEKVNTHSNDIGTDAAKYR